MHLLGILGVTSSDQIDPAQSLTLGILTLSSDAAVEAIRIIDGGDFVREVRCFARPFRDQVYWSIAHQTEGEAEVFGYPSGTVGGLPTSTEIALIRALAAAPPEQHGAILGGNVEVALGRPAACDLFREIIGTAPPFVGSSLLYQGATQAVLREDVHASLDRLAVKCLTGSFVTAPLKFRFLEIYRIIEARFIREIKSRLLSRFDREPLPALNEATEALKSEMNQLMALADTQQHAFAACWDALDQIRVANRFSAIMFRRASEKGHDRGSKWRTGAALIYQVRCAIVHAGERDIVYDNFTDGDDALRALIPHVERAALLLIRVELS